MVKFSAFDKFNIDKDSLLFLHLSDHLPLSLSFSKSCFIETIYCQFKNVPYNSVLPKYSKLFCTYTSFYFTMFFIFVEFPVVVYFVLLKHSLHHAKNCLCVMTMVFTSMWIRISQCIHVYDVKSCFAHGWHRVGVEEGNSLKEEMTKMFYWGSNRCLSFLLRKRQSIFIIYSYWKG